MQVTDLISVDLLVQWVPFSARESRAIWPAFGSIYLLTCRERTLEPCSLLVSFPIGLGSKEEWECGSEGLLIDLESENQCGRGTTTLA